MRRLSQYNIGLVLLTTVLVIVFVVNRQNFWIVLFCTQAIMIVVVVASLCVGIPASLTKSSRDNCFRIDGSLSSRRELRERAAKAKVRSNFYAIVFTTVLSGNLLVLMIDSTVIPVSVAGESLAAFRFDTASWREEISSRNLDGEYSAWLGPSGNGDVSSRPHFIKTSFPILMIAAAFWFIGGCALIRRSYLLTLQEYSSGIQSRFAEYLNADLGRLQESANVCH